MQSFYIDLNSFFTEFPPGPHPVYHHVFGLCYHLPFPSGIPSTYQKPWWPMVKNPTVNARDAGDMGSIPELGRSPGGGNGNPLQYSCLENPMDRETW